MNKSLPAFLCISLLCLLLPVTAAASGIKNGQTLRYTEKEGRIVDIPIAPKRVAVLYNSLLELWLYSGGTAVARVKGEQNLPASAHGIEVLGTVGHPNVERLAELEPDLVILSSNMRNHRKIRMLLDENGIATLMVRYDHYEDFYRIARLFARLNRTETEMDAKIQAMKKEMATVSALCRKKKPPRVLVLFSSANALSCELSNGDTGRLVELLGGRNIAREIRIDGVRRVDINLEFVVRQDPEVILIKTMGRVEKCRERVRKEFSRSPVWAGIQAVRNGRVHVLPKTLFLYKSNHRYPRSLRFLANLLYPGFTGGSGTPSETKGRGDD